MWIPIESQSPSSPRKPPAICMLLAWGTSIGALGVRRGDARRRSLTEGEEQRFKGISVVFFCVGLAELARRDAGRDRRRRDGERERERRRSGRVGAGRIVPGLTRGGVLRPPKFLAGGEQRARPRCGLLDNIHGGRSRPSGWCREFRVLRVDLSWIDKLQVEAARPEHLVPPSPLSMFFGRSHQGAVSLLNDPQASRAFDMSSAPPDSPLPPSSSSHPTPATASSQSASSNVPRTGAAVEKKRNHICQTCSKAFTTSGHLARHIRVHTGERNHKCPFPGCETRCSRQDNLQQQSVPPSSLPLIDMCA